MGGCRCSYRTCKAKSDGQIHMFHFPVFDKIRCHQWITNSHKPNFLNLKLSQLKNRVVCQDHFTDDSFMNFKRAKLKSSAIPTEDGPNCGSPATQVKIAEDKPVIVINADDIENETLNCVDKKAHSSIKYGDFLISDVTELFNSSHNSTQAAQKVRSNRLVSKTVDASQNHEETLNYTIVYPNDDDQTKMCEVASTNSLAPIQYYEDLSLPNKSFTAEIQQEPQNYNSTGYLCNTFQNTANFNISKDKMVTVISEQKISEPVHVKGKLEPLSPSMILRRPARKCKERLLEVSFVNDFQASNNNVKPQEELVIIGQTVPIEYTPQKIENKIDNNQNINENVSVKVQSPIINISDVEHQKNIDDGVLKQSPIINMNDVKVQKNSVKDQENIDDGVPKQKDKIPIQNDIEEVFLNCMLKTAENLIKPEEKRIITPTCTPAFKSLLKNKVTPEKLAAIEQKRKFNLKLRDVITSCLDNLENQNALNDKNRNQERKQTGQILHAKAPASSKPQDSMITYLETRLQRMEDTLLNKIDNNTQKINALKRSIKPSSNSKKTQASTQTYLNHMSEQSQKQYLFMEISKYLSPCVNIKVYEELFKDKTEQSASETASPRKLRKRR